MPLRFCLSALVGVLLVCCGNVPKLPYPPRTLTFDSPLYLPQAWDVAEVWVTEFAFVPAYSYNAEREARAFVTWLEQTPRITRYAPFVAHIACDWSWPDCRKSADPSLFDAFGQLTETGTWYVKDKW